MKNYLFLIIVFSLFTLGCATKQVAQIDKDFTTARWKTELNVKDLKTQKEQSLKLAIVGEKNLRARVEATATLGYPVASIVLTQDQIRAAVHPKKQFLTGTNQSRALERIIRVSLTTTEFLNILFAQRLSQKKWNCKINSEGQPTECQSLNRETSIEWTYLDANEKKIKIASSRIELEWRIEAPQTSVEIKEALFRLEPLSGYKTIQIN